MLTDLITQIKTDEQQLHYTRKDRLIAVAEYILNNYSEYREPQAYRAAIILLAKYHLAPLASRKHGRKRIAKERAKKYQARCSNCGAIISSPESLKTGLGRICRKKAGVKA